MKFVRNHLKILTVAASCAALGIGAGVIANAGAATSGTTAGGSHAARGGMRAGRLLRRTVQGDVVVATRTGFATVTFERGFVQSVSGQQLTLTEATKKATYKTVTLTIPTDAVVRDNRAKATLASIQSGQRVLVVQAPKRTYVIARTRR
jgi:hypothetical protein